MGFMEVGIAVAAAGSVASAAGSFTAAAGSRREGRRQAALAQREGKEAKTLADYETRLIYEAGADVLGEIEAETGKSGLAMTGSPLDHLVRTARRIELTAALKQREGEITKHRYEQQSQAGLAAGQNLYTAGILQGLGSLAKLGELIPASPAAEAPPMGRGL